MQRDLHRLWRGLRRHDDVRCIVLTGAGEKAFCTGIDRMEQMGGEGTPAPVDDDRAIGSGSTPFMFNDPGDLIGPKSCDLWKPVIAAVNGMACGGAFYMLGEVEFIIAADHATFFDPHVTYGMTAAYEPIHMSGIMPFPEIMRLSLLGNHERMSAQRAHEIGMVTEVAPKERAARAGRVGRVADRLAAGARDRGHGARALGCSRARRPRGAEARVRVRRHGDEPRFHRGGPEGVRVRHAHRLEAAVSRDEASRDRRSRAVRLRARRHEVPVRAALPGREARARRRRAHQGRRRRLRLERHGPARPGRDRRVPRPAPDVDRRHRRRWRDLGRHGRARGRGDPRRPRRGRRARLRVHHARRPEVEAAPGQPRVRHPRPGPVRRAVRARAHRQVRDGHAPAHVRVRHDDRAAGRDRGVDPVQRRRSTPTRTTGSRSRSTTSSRRR